MAPARPSSSAHRANDASVLRSRSHSATSTAVESNPLASRQKLLSGSLTRMMNEIEYSSVSAPTRMAHTPAKRSYALDVVPRTPRRSVTAMVAMNFPLRLWYARIARSDHRRLDERRGQFGDPGQLLGHAAFVVEEAVD